MIKIVNNNIDTMINCLNQDYDCDCDEEMDDVYLHIVEDADVIESPDGGKGFGVYVPKDKAIYVAGNVPDPEYTVPETIAHEFYHYLQDEYGREFNEEEAEKFAEAAMKRYIKN